MTAFLNQHYAVKNVLILLFTLCLTLFLSSCTVDANPNPTPRVIAHQGGYGQWPSNTLFAFDKASQLEQVDEFELDIHQSADGHIVIMHDETVDRTTNGSGEIKNMTLKEIQSLDAGYYWYEEKPNGVFPFRNKGITVPTLNTLLARYPNKPMSIEIKTASTRLAKDLCQLLKQANKTPHVKVSSYHHQAIVAFRTACPTVKTGASSQEANRYVIASKFGLGAFFKPDAEILQLPVYSGNIDVLTPRFIQQAHKHGFEIDAWTINEEAEMQKMMSLGVDGIITDFPSRLITTMKHKQ